MSGSNRQALVTPLAPSASESFTAAPSQLDPLTVAASEAQTGEPQSIRRFLEGVAPLVRRTCNGVLGSTHPELEDAIQEGLLASVRALPQYRFDGNIRHYVAKIALRIAIAARRRTAARWRQHEAIEQDAKSSAASAQCSSEDADLVHRILDKLSEQQSEALLLRVVCGFSISEIAVLTGVSPNTVKTRLRLAKNTLRASAKRKSFWRRLFSKDVNDAKSLPADDSEEQP